MSRRVRSALTFAAVSATAGCGLFGGSSTFPAASPASVALHAKLSRPVHVGLIVSAHAPSAEGRGDAPLASGARVAQVRFVQGGTPVVLDIEDDHGTAAGARLAVESLTQMRVVGIVYASEGEHIAAGLQAARQAHIAVLLPYAGALPDGSAGGAWLTGPSQAQIVHALVNRLGQERLTGAPVLSLGPLPTDALPLALGGRAHRLSSAAAVKPTDVPTAAKAVVVWAPAAESAAVVERLQAVKVNLPVVLSAAALSTDFAATLARDQSATGAATNAGRYLTAGLPTALDGARTAGFSAALRLAGNDPHVQAVTGSATFGTLGMETADGRSHDAVVALVVAAARATRPTAASVLALLPRLHLGPNDGLVGPPLSFTAPESVDPGDVAALQSGVSGDGRQLVWFALPPVTATS